MSSVLAECPTISGSSLGTHAAEKIVVGIGDMQLARGGGRLVMTYGLGSCLGVSLWDPELQLGALLHAMLPSSKLATDKTRANPFMFVDTGVPETFRRCFAEGADKQRIECRVAGGACTYSDPAQDVFQIGAKNLQVLYALLQKNDVRLLAKDVGGHHSRTLTLDVMTGKVTIQHGRTTTEL